MNVGDTVRVIPPHPEVGAIGVVRNIYAPNAEMDRRARVEFSDPYPGFGTVGLTMLEVVNDEVRTDKAIAREAAPAAEPGWGASGPDLAHRREHADPARSDVYPPEVEAIGEMRMCTDEEHAHGCPCQVGGDPVPREDS